MSKMITKFALAGLVASALAGQAYAVESVTPYLPCNSCGVPVGALPPAGFYFSDETAYIDGSVVNNSGVKIPVNVTAFLTIPVLLYVPNVHVLGASAALALVQPISENTTTAFGSTSRQTGLFNTILGGTLSWALPNGLFVSGGLGVYLNDGTYNVRQATNIANNYTTFEPNVGISWLNNGWNLSLHLVVDTNTENTADHYQSGNIFFTDYTVAKTFGKWTFGVVGDYVQQFSNDTLRGVTLANSEVGQFAVGPQVSYDFGPVTMTTFYTRDVWAQNGGQTDKFWLRFAFPL